MKSNNSESECSILTENPEPKEQQDSHGCSLCNEQTKKGFRSSLHSYVDNLLLVSLINEVALKFSKKVKCTGSGLIDQKVVRLYNLPREISTARVIRHRHFTCNVELN